MSRCGDCRYAEDTRDDEELLTDGEPILRCGYTVPFWVPLPVHDYRSWVNADDGAKCNAFKAAE